MLGHRAAKLLKRKASLELMLAHQRPVYSRWDGEDCDGDDGLSDSNFIARKDWPLPPLPSAKWPLFNTTTASVDGEGVSLSTKDTQDDDPGPIAGSDSEISLQRLLDEVTLELEQRNLELEEVIRQRDSAEAKVDELEDQSATCCPVDRDHQRSTPHAGAGLTPMQVTHLQEHLLNACDLIATNSYEELIGGAITGARFALEAEQIVRLLTMIEREDGNEATERTDGHQALPPGKYFGAVKLASPSRGENDRGDRSTSSATFDGDLDRETNLHGEERQTVTVTAWRKTSPGGDSSSWSIKGQGRLQHAAKQKPGRKTAPESGHRLSDKRRRTELHLSLDTIREEAETSH